MRYGLIFSGGGTTVRQMVSLARDAEAAGLDSVFVTEAWRSGFVGPAAIATATERIRIGPYVLNAYARSPWITGLSAIDLDELSGGRLLLAVGSGNKHINEDWQGIPQSRPLRKMEEYVTLLKRIVTTRLGETLRWEGDLHRMRWPPSVAPHRPAIPVYLAALYPRMTALAGRVADGLALGALLSPAYVRDVILPRAASGALEAGRDPSSLGTLAAPFVSTGADPEAARQAARQALCRLYWPLPHPYYDYVLREQGFSKVADAAAKYVPDGRLEAAVEAIPDDVLDTVAIAGSVEDCRRRLAPFEGVVDELLFVNVNYSAESQEGLLAAFRSLIDLARRAGAA